MVMTKHQIRNTVKSNLREKRAERAMKNFMMFICGVSFFIGWVCGLLTMIFLKGG